MLRLSLAARITMIVVIALTTVWIVAIAVFYRSRNLENEGARPSPQQIAALVDLIERTPPEQRPLVLAAVKSGTLDARLEAGKAFGAAPDNSPIAGQAIRKSYAAALGDRTFTIALPALTGIQRRLPRLFARATNALDFRIRLHGGETLVVDTRNPVAVTRLGLPVGFGAGLFGTFIALIALIIMYRETKPLARLAAAVDRMDPAGKPVLLPPARSSAPEIQALVQAFNRLQTRLAHLIRARMAMLGGISHDVRTFATRLRLRTDAIPDAAERERAVADIADMIRLLDDALLTSRASARELAEEMIEFDELVHTEVEDRRAAGAAVDLTVAADSKGVSVLGDRLALRRIIANLTDNALKYGYAAHVAVTTEGGLLELTVDDDGSGIPPDLRGLLLEPFVRLEGSRNRSTSGAGLGLAVVRSLVEAQGGSIAIGDAPTGGARLTLRLPIFKGF